jgi:hypothetical protein
MLPADVASFLINSTSRELLIMFTATTIIDESRRRAMDAAYQFALQTMVNDFHATDTDEIAGVAAAYALEHWEEWLADSDWLIELNVDISEEESPTYSVCYIPEFDRTDRTREAA